jgi:glutathione S-transferase
MALDFYYGSGSPYAWRVWLALEHKRLPYEFHLLSFDKGDLKTPAYLRMNPRGRVPVIADNGFTVYESAAIVEYLEQAHSGSGAPLFARDARAAATTRRMIREADEYLAHAMEALVERILFTEPAQWDAQEIEKAREAFGKELSHFEASKLGEGAPDAADYTVYPMIALALRLQKKKPDLGISALVGPRLSGWMKKIEALPFFDKTLPPHWRPKP